MTLSYRRSQNDLIKYTVNQAYPPCVEHDLQVVEKKSENGRSFYKNQCRICGKMVGESISKKNAKGLKIGEHNPFLDEFIRNKKSDLYKDMVKIIKNIEETKGMYDEYLKSDKWKSKRSLVLKRDNYTCQNCFETPESSSNLHVHHITYEHIYDEFSFELITLCIPCHEKYHSAKIISLDDMEKNQIINAKNKG